MTEKYKYSISHSANQALRAITNSYGDEDVVGIEGFNFAIEVLKEAIRQAEEVIMVLESPGKGEKVVYVGRPKQ